MNSKVSQSRSLEEIPEASKSDIISRTHKTRHTLQATPQAHNHALLRLTQSQNYGRKKLPRTIPENENIEEEDEEESVRVRIENERKSKRRGSVNSKQSGRSRSGSTSSRSQNNGTGQVNQSYDGALDGISTVSTRSFDRDNRLRGSGRSSNRTSSIQSLEVQREQYCCFSRWSPCERKLAALVAVLATIIIILAIVVAVLAGQGDEGSGTKFMWSL